MDGDVVLWHVLDKEREDDGMVGLVPLASHGRFGPRAGSRRGSGSWHCDALLRLFLCSRDRHCSNGGSRCSRQRLWCTGLDLGGTLAHPHLDNAVLWDHFQCLLQRDGRLLWLAQSKERNPFVVRLVQCTIRQKTSTLDVAMPLRSRARAPAPSAPHPTHLWP